MKAKKEKRNVKKWYEWKKKEIIPQGSSWHIPKTPSIPILHPALINPVLPQTIPPSNHRDRDGVWSFLWHLELNFQLVLEILLELSKWGGGLVRKRNCGLSIHTDTVVSSSSLIVQNSFMMKWEGRKMGRRWWNKSRNRMAWESRTKSRLRTWWYHPLGTQITSPSCSSAITSKPVSVTKL